MNDEPMSPERRKALIKRFRALPQEEKTLIAKRAFQTVEECITEFTKALIETEPDPDLRALVLEQVWGWRADETSEEALKDDSEFSRKYDLAVEAAILVEMETRNQLDEEPGPQLGHDDGTAGYGTGFE